MKIIGIFGDTYKASTGFAIVCRNLANQLSRWFRVIYFGRFGQEHEFADEAELPETEFFSYVPCIGGVWDRELCVRILKHYKPDLVFTEDDWYSAHGILGACKFWSIPFYFLTPIDSLPIHPDAFSNIFTFCDKIFIPNSSYLHFNGRERLKFDSAVNKRQGDRLKAIFLPHGVDSEIFYRKKVARPDKFTFLWIGRSEERKAPDKVILAYEKIYKKMDSILLLRTDWSTPYGQRLLRYIERRNLPVMLDQMQDVPHHEISNVYNMGDINICSSKAGGFEMNITESAACGLPTITVDWTFMNENVVDGKSGFKIPVESFCHPSPSNHPKSLDRIWGNISIDALAEKMLWCYNNEAAVKSMGRWAADYVKEKYNWVNVAKTLKEEILTDG